MQKSVWQTPEFWASMISQIVGIVVLTGGMTSDQGTEVTKALQAISGGVMSLISVLGLIWAQHSRRDTAASVVNAQLYAVQDITKPVGTDNAVNASSTGNSHLAAVHAKADEFVKSL
jgi:hypothetical protein